MCVLFLMRQGPVEIYKTRWLVYPMVKRSTKATIAELRRRVGFALDTAKGQNNETLYRQLLKIGSVLQKLEMDIERHEDWLSR